MSDAVRDDGALEQEIENEVDRIDEGGEGRPHVPKTQSSGHKVHRQAFLACKLHDAGADDRGDGRSSSGLFALRKRLTVAPLDAW